MRILKLWVVVSVDALMPGEEITSSKGVTAVADKWLLLGVYDLWLDEPKNGTFFLAGRSGEGFRGISLRVSAERRALRGARQANERQA